ncbi:MAG: thioredoxin domain-containing protein [Silvanigrellales bacterium]|nr:thioredoxin domain-containing protein [Silvanigrellales bacterium]
MPTETHPNADTPAVVDKRTALAVGTLAALLLATLAGVGGLVWGKSLGAGARSGQNGVAATSGSEHGAGRLQKGPPAPSSVLLEWQGKAIRFADLPAPVREKISTAAAKRDAGSEEALFQAEYAYARELDNALRNFVVAELARKGAQEKGVSLEEATQSLTSPEKVGVEDARDLFEASDPSAPSKDFERVKLELLAYIEEVARREATDRLLSKLQATKALRLHLQRPSRKAFRFSEETLSAFPSVGRKDAPLTLVNFTDFLCDECPEYNLKLSELVVKHGLDARFVFIPFPYTRPDKAMSLARGAMCAHEQGEYLDFHMGLVALGMHARKTNALEVSRRASSALDARAFARCYREGTGVAGLLSAAQMEARRAGIMSVPVSFLQGEMHEGSLGLTGISAGLTKASE